MFTDWICPKDSPCNSILHNGIVFLHKCYCNIICLFLLVVGISSHFTLGVRVAASENVSVLRLLCKGEAYLALGALSRVETNLHLFTGGKNVSLYTCLPGHTCRAGFDDETSASHHLTQAFDWALATECQQ